MKVVASRRTSLIIDPPDGGLPALLPAAQARAARPKSSNDDPELLGLDERCLLTVAFGSSNASPPMVPNPVRPELLPGRPDPRSRHDLHGNRPRRADHPDRRTAPAAARAVVARRLDWALGRRHPRRRHDELHREDALSRIRFAPARRRALHAHQPKHHGLSIHRRRSGHVGPAVDREIPFSATHERMFEYACHEGNHSMESVLRGARAEEKRKQD